MDELPPWFELAAVATQPWALLMILPSLIVGITATWTVLKIKEVSKAGLKVASSNSNEKKGTGDDRLQTDDLLLCEVGVEGSKNMDESKTVVSQGSNLSFSKTDNMKKTELLDPARVDKSISSETKLGVTNTVSKLRETKSETKITNPLPPTLKFNLDAPSSSPSTTVSNESIKAINNLSNNATPLEDSKKVSFNESADSLKILDSSKLDSSLKESVSSLESYESTKKKPDTEDVNLLINSVASSGNSLEGSNVNAPKLTSEEISSYSSEKVEGQSYQMESNAAKKPITDFDPTFVDVTPERKLNIGRSSKSKKTQDSPPDVLEKSDPGDGSPLMPPNETPKKAEARIHCYSADDAVKNVSSVSAVPDLISTKKSNTSNKHYDFNALQSFFNDTKDGKKISDAYPLSNLNKPKMHAKPIPVDVIDPLTIPGYMPSISERPILPKDFIKLTEPAAITSYDLVPGPPLLKTISNIWKYVPLLGTQFVATFIYTLQSLVSSFDRKLNYPYMYPYYYLLNKYGPMVRLHGPIGADILVMAVNGLDLPVVHIKTRGNNKQSLFDSLNLYRREATSLSYASNVNPNSKNLPGNPTVLIDQHYDSLERITDDFLKRKKFTRSYTGMKENENHGNDLLVWAMQCTMDVYFKTSKDFLRKSEVSKIIESFIKLSNSLRICETGIQLWRFVPTLTWLDLTDSCKEMDSFIIDEVSDCMKNTNQGKKSGSVLEVLLTTDELKPSDLLTPLTDLLVININTVVSLAGFLIYNLSKSPQSQRTLFREISSVLPKGKTNIQQADLAKLKYLNACITETLRMVPPFPVLSRQIEEDTRIHRFQIPKGTFIQMVNVLPCTRGDVRNDNVGKFQAERWTEKTTKLGGDPLMGLPQWESFPKFNRDLVVTQVALLVAKVVRERRIEYPSAEVYADGMVLQGPSTPFNYSFIERVL